MEIAECIDEKTGEVLTKGESPEKKEVKKKSKRVDPNNLTSVDRTKLEKLITERKQNIISGLNRELFDRNDELLEEIKDKLGIKDDSTAIQGQIDLLDAQIEDIIGANIQEENNKRDIQIADAKARHNIEYRILQEMHEKEEKELKEKQVGEREAIASKFMNIKSKIKTEKCPELVSQKTELLKQLSVVNQMEQYAEKLLNDKKVRLKKSKLRIENTVMDSTSRVLEKLWIVTSRQEAAELIGQIPTLEETMRLLNDDDGINQFLKRVNPNTKFLLPPPEPTVIPQFEPDIEELKDASEEKPEVKKDEEEN